MENHLAVFTGAGLEDMLDDDRVGGVELAVPRVHKPAGGMRQRVIHMLIEQPVEVVELPEHGADERRPVPVLVSPGELPGAEDGEGRHDGKDVEGHRQQRRREHREQAEAC